MQGAFPGPARLCRSRGSTKAPHRAGQTHPQTSLHCEQGNQGHFLLSKCFQGK